MKEQLIYLDRSDDFHSARDRIGWAQADRVLLVWPASSRGRSIPILSRKIDLVLLRRHAARLGARLGLVTNAEAVIDNATDLGLPIFDSVRDGHLFAWRENGAALPRYSRQARRFPRPSADEDAWISWPRPRWLFDGAVPTIARWLLFAAATGATLLMLALVAPSASIRLAPHVQHINAQLTLRADPTVSGIDAAAYTVPARTAEVQVEGTVQVPTTGAAEQATQRAQGTVTFTNLTDQPARVPAGTAVRTTSSLPTRFVTQQDVTLDAESGAKADVPILAVEPGPSGNVGPGLINAIEGPLELQVAVVNLHETGGGDVAIVSAVAAADRARARAQLEAELVQRGYGEIVSALRLGEFSPIATARIVDVADVAYDLESGDLGDALTLDMRATVVASVVNESDAFSIGRSELHARVGDSLELLAGTIHIERGEVLAADDTGAVEFEIVARGDAGPVIDPDEVRSTIRWKEYGHAQALLRSTFPVAQPPTVQIWPKWFPRMPWLAWRIAVDVTSDAASGS